ncbi:glutathionylspermidine synthase family protein [Hymenobacter busanensis]|uniref:Glutathionylspermidine synthase family protein n=1 Tax=Hymenobacter busanensis TaxID=2607656 RepID=A0A7L4ZZK5_9BACT|nr:glutathionylspermidine synthase family protein [Hymenobacter busanensis]KAA9331316.1 glutathionylspermidine synthase family protein [Hymenobacter busanensis]QHJ08467.1 glutathionylspermidine synthase family protein [Hymenobacter busanensis]
MAAAIRLIPLGGDVTPAIRALGWDWAVEDACAAYLAREAVQLTEAQAEELLNAADTLYDMLVQAIPDPIPDDLLRLLAIPENLWAAVRHSWNDDRHWHLYGRFDLAPTAEGPKLIEFNADTATSLPETAVVQWASLVAAGHTDEERQANGLFEGLEAQLHEWRGLNPDLDPSLLLVHLPDSAEDETNCAVVAEAARAAGFASVHVCSVDAMQVSVAGDERGVWAQTGPDEWQRFGFLFKLVPWEILAEEEPELTADLTQLLLSRDVIVANPAYTLLFQSKGLLAWLWQVFPHHPLLLEAAMEDLPGHYVRKPLFGREGQNVSEVQDGRVTHAEAGDFDHQPHVRQRWAELPTDVQGRKYQAGVFWAGEACAISFRRAAGVITNLSEFVPHILGE